MRRNQTSPIVRPTRHTADISCQIVRLRDFHLVADRITEVSPKGLLATPADPVMTGEPVIVSFRLPYWGRFLDLSATVTRVVHGRRPGDPSRALGLEFDGVDDWSRRLLELTLRWLPPAPPRFRLGRRRSAPNLEKLVRSSTRLGGAAPYIALPAG